MWTLRCRFTAFEKKNRTDLDMIFFFRIWEKTGKMSGHKRHTEELEKNKEAKRPVEVGQSLHVEVFLTGSTAVVSRYGLGWVSSFAFSSRLDGWRDGAYESGG